MRANSDEERLQIPQVLIVCRDEIEHLLNVNDALKAVEVAFKLCAIGKTFMPPKIYLDVPDKGGDFRAMPACIDNMAGLKWVCVYPNNKENNLPTVMATIILSDPNTGCTLAIMDGTYITNIRTGCAGGVAVKYLARSNSSTIGLIGAGIQADTQLLAIHKVLPEIKEVRVFDTDENKALMYAYRMIKELDIDVRPVKTLKEATEVDILVTTTPSRTPIIKEIHVKPGTHINAIGADAPGKQEIEYGVLKKAKVIVDDIEQAYHSGEINVNLSQGLMTTADIFGTLGEIVAGLKSGRENNDEITIFDSTGLAIHDIICAKLVYEKAKEIKDSKSKLFQLIQPARGLNV